MAKKPTAEDAQIVMQLYDLRRESEMRKARHWFAGFWPQNADDVLTVINAGNSQENAWFRQVSGYWDMAEEWDRFTGRAFVFAFWAVREEALKKTNLDLAAIFQESRDHGLAPNSRRQIAETWALRLGLEKEEIERYLTENIQYVLDRTCLEGLELFYRYALESKLVPSVPELRFLSPRPALT